ncbi:dual specificity protein phosphatase 13B-like isoform X1 [Pseudorasbora parva]|uniref:dual specificity protein phosphatase 13B-like isoform X1 n=1 Tax=Pseudorasbora parva TaxID=51549 RepID=UPI00351E9C70
MDEVCETPSIRELEKILFGGKRSGNHADEVWPNLFLGDMSVANDRFSLWKLGITHVLNAAHGKMHCQGSHKFYGSTVRYYGVPADDSPSFNLSVYFQPCADHIKEVLSSGGVQRRADMPRDDRYETPPASELQRLLWIKPGASSHLDEVRPGIYIGDMYAAKDKHMLQSLNITYVLNAAHGKFNVNTGASYYRDTKITYRGVEAFDMPSFDLSPFFYTAAKFIKSAMSTPGGKVLVHCAMGLSRSSSLVLAYLMIHEDMTLVEAIKAVAQHRNICPNSGFMEQLRELDKKLHFQRTAL